MTMFRGDAFGMELDALNVLFAMLQAHDRAIRQTCGNLQTIGQTVAIDDQRMIPRRLKRRGQARENAALLMGHCTHFAMDDFMAAHNFAAKSLTNRLMPKTNPDQGHICRCGLAGQLKTNACLIRVARTGRQKNRIGFHRQSLVRAQRIVAAHDDICPQFTRTHVNFQRVPMVDTSNPFIARHVPSADESMLVIRFANPKGIDFPYLLNMLHNSFMSRPNTLVVPGGKMELAMQLIFTPFIWRLMDRKGKA